METIPQEMVDAIIFHLKSDSQSLQACSLVSHSFRLPSQRHIFHRVRLAPPLPTKRPGSQSIPGNTCDRFFNLLSTSPTIAFLVNDLIIDTGDSKPWSGPWVSTSSKLPEVIRMLSNLQSISLYYAAFFSSLKWRDLPTDFQQTLICVLKGSLKSLSLSGITFESYREFSQVFSDCYTLSELSFTSVRIQETEEGKPDSSSTHRPQLRSLSQLCRAHRGQNTSWLSYANTLFDLSQLRELSVDTAAPDDYRHVWSILLKTASTLKHLSIWFSYDRSFTQLGPLDVSQLSTVSLHMMIESFEQLCDIISWLVTVFSHVTRSNSLEEIDLHFDCMFAQSPFSLDIPQWTHLDVVFMRPEFAPLKRVGIEIKATRDMWKNPLSPGEPFPLLRSIGKLSTENQVSGPLGRIKKL